MQRNPFKKPAHPHRDLRRTAVVLVALMWHVGVAPLASQAVQPTPEEMSLRDAWVKEHFPANTSGMRADVAPTKTPTARVGRVAQLRRSVPQRSSRQRTADRRSCVRSRHLLPCTYPHGGASAGCGQIVLINRRHPHQPGFAGRQHCFHGDDRRADSVYIAGHASRRGRRSGDGRTRRRADFFLSVSDAGDGISSDQGVWGEATVTLMDGTELRLSDLPLRDALVCERSNATPPFSFLYDGQTSDTLLPTWKFQEEKDTSDPKKTKRVRTYTDPKTGLMVRNTVVEYADYPTVEWTLDFQNTGDQDTPIIGGIQSLDTSFVHSTDGELSLHSIKGDSCTADSYQPFTESMPAGFSKRMASQGGRPTNGSFPYWNIATGDGGYLAVLGWPGQWSAQFERDATKVLRIHAGQELTHFKLHPGEEVRSPLAVLQFYKGDWIRGQNLWRRWMVAHNLPRPGGKLVPTHYAACFGTDLVPTAADELAVIDGFQREGIQLDYWILDSGWFSGRGNWFENTGSWEVDTQRFPKGVREVSDRSHAHGMDFVLWFEPERAWSGTWLALQHPEWILGGADGGLVNLGNREAWKWVVERIDSLINSEGVDVYRQDFNIDPLGFWRGADTDDRQGISEIAHVDGYLKFWRELLRRHPKLWIDSCASGGRRNDLETMRLVGTVAAQRLLQRARVTAMPDVRTVAVASLLRLGAGHEQHVLVPQLHLPGLAGRVGHAQEGPRLSAAQADAGGVP